MVGRRRSKQIDGFRERPGEVQVPVLMDDPLLASMNLEDIKSFLDVGETGLVDARYRAAKFVRNQVRILLNNEWCQDKEPDLPYYDHIGWTHFHDMFAPAVSNASNPHLMAILKRASVVLAGNKAVYVRLPSEHQSERIYRFEGGGLTEDWLQEKNKPYCGMYEDGMFVKYSGYEDALENEATLLSDLLASPEEKEYMRRGATYDNWAADYGNTQEHPTTPTRDRASGSAMPSGLSGTSPLLSQGTQDIVSGCYSGCSRE